MSYNTQETREIRVSSKIDRTALRDTLLIVSSCGKIMMTASELIYLDTLYVLCFDLRRDRDTQPREMP